MASGSTITPEDVHKVIKTAKLHGSELRDLSQILSFADDTPQYDNLRFMQLDEHLLAELMAGSRLVFKGDTDESAVLCTSTRTYDVKETETSNSLLLVPDLLFAAGAGIEEDSNRSTESNKSLDNSNTSLNKSNDSDDMDYSHRIVENKTVLKTFHTYFELRPCKPRLDKIRKLLLPTQYTGPENEYAIDKTALLTYEDLLDRVQASESELKEGLTSVQAIELNGHYRILEFDYEFRILSYMLDLVDENSWSINAVRRDVTLESLKTLVPEGILAKLFEFYTEEGEVVDGEQCYEYKEGMVCRFLAQVLLKSAGKFYLPEFLQAWKDSVPEGMVAEESMLAGVALIDRDSTPPVIWGFSEANLPEDINERFKLLFQTKAKWTVDQISPYIQCFTTDKLNVNGLLTKHARASTVNGVRFYSAKHSK